MTKIRFQLGAHLFMDALFHFWKNMQHPLWTFLYVDNWSNGWDTKIWIWCLRKGELYAFYKFTLLNFPMGKIFWFLLCNIRISSDYQFISHNANSVGNILVFIILNLQMCFRIFSCNYFQMLLIYEVVFIFSKMILLFSCILLRNSKNQKYFSVGCDWNR